jgi:hypothetical protein
MRHIEPSKTKIALGLFGASLFFVVLKFVEALLSGGGSGEGHVTWIGVLSFAAVAMLIFWYAVFVLWSREKSWFGVLRRPINAVLFAGFLGMLIWMRRQSIDPALWGAVAVGLAAGWFADKWIEGI